MKVNEKKEFEKHFNEVNIRPLELFTQEDFPIYGKLLLGILVSLILITGLMMFVDQIYYISLHVRYGFLEIKQYTFDLYFACFGFSLLLIVLFIETVIDLVKKNLIKKPSYNELFLILGGVLTITKINERKQHTQDSIKVNILDNYPIKNVKDRKMSSIFAEANKRHKHYHQNKDSKK